MVELASLRLGFAFGLGTATFFAPCAFPLLPGYVAFYLGGDEDERPPLASRLLRAVVVGVVTSVGFFAVYAVLAGLALAVGTQALANVSVLELVVGALLILLGLAMVTDRFDPTMHVQLPERRRGPVGYFLFGVIYAAAAAGCTAPLFVAIAGLAVASGPAGAIATFGAYAAGMAVLMVGVTLLSALGKETLVRRLSSNTGRIRRLAGAVLVIAGVVQIYYFLFVFDGLRTLGLA